MEGRATLTIEKSRTPMSWVVASSARIAARRRCMAGLPHAACITEAWPRRFEPPRDDALRVNADGRLRFREGLRGAADLDATRPPWGQHVIDDDGGAAAAGDVPVFLGRCEVVPADVDRVEVRVVCPADWH